MSISFHLIVLNHKRNYTIFLIIFTIQKYLDKNEIKLIIFDLSDNFVRKGMFSDSNQTGGNSN